MRSALLAIVLFAFVPVAVAASSTGGTAPGSEGAPVPAAPPLVALQEISAAPAQQGTPPLIEQPITEQPEPPPDEPTAPEQQEQKEPPAEVEVPQEVGQETPSAQSPPPTSAPAVPSVSLPRTGSEPLLLAAAGYALLLPGVAIVRSLWLTREAGAGQSAT